MLKFKQSDLLLKHQSFVNVHVLENFQFHIPTFLKCVIHTDSNWTWTIKHMFPIKVWERV